MKAKSAKSVAEPSDAGAEYFMEQRAKFNIGVRAKTSVLEMPVSGVWGFRELDKAAFKSWIWSNRHAVWAMLYGSMKTGKQ